jgi:RIO-like serine/threonine protein kinase
MNEFLKSYLLDFVRLENIIQQQFALIRDIRVVAKYFDKDVQIILTGLCKNILEDCFVLIRHQKSVSEAIKILKKAKTYTEGFIFLIF